VATVTFIIIRQHYLDGRNQFTVLRVLDNRMDVVSHHASAEEALEAAHRYASQARFSGLDARVFQRD
jgi:hypothetical protein